jgi:ABC-type Fe3+/spermidine/putrescine transport system ATPase subunit
VGEFLGRTVSLEGRVRREAGRGWIDILHETGRFAIAVNHGDRFSEGDQVRILTRPEDIDILPMGKVEANHLVAKIEEVAYLGDHVEYSVSAGGRSFLLAAGKRERHPVGTEVRLLLNPDQITILPMS